MGAEAALWFAFREDQLLVNSGRRNSVPYVASLEEIGLQALFCHKAGVLNGSPCYTVELEPEVEPPEGMAFQDLRSFLLLEVDERFFAMAGRAKQIVEWSRTHRFCGRCGAQTVAGPTDFAKECPRCGLLFYPRLSPAVIVLVTDTDRVLLARSPGFPLGMYSVLAGFVEPGESIEEAIEREICEEVGVEVGNIRYFGSQPWPFPNSLMIGFTADYTGGELRIDPTEIEDAGWYSVDDLPELPPKISIARAMIDRLVAQHDLGPKGFEAPVE
ncbi:MAG: NAD(+) diphosphatase [Actinomycetota bacterium]|nr:NAD(+) diphosphatase [Actinomycetota bacterium]